VDAFPPDRVYQFARESGFVQRERKIDPVAFLLCLALDFGVGLQRQLQRLRAGCEERTHPHRIAYSSFYNRFTPGPVDFLRRCVAHALGQLATDPGREMGERLKDFSDILVKDSSVVRLHASLATKFPATRPARSLRASRSTPW